MKLPTVTTERASGLFIPPPPSSSFLSSPAPISLSEGCIRRKMTSKSPVFPVPEPQHYSDYGFDPQIDYFQILQEARRHSKREARSLDALHFKLQKPISKEDSKWPSKNKKRSRWWRNALLFWKWKRSGGEVEESCRQRKLAAASSLTSCPSPSYYYYPRQRSVSGPVYVTDSLLPLSSATTPCRSISRPISGPLKAMEMGKVEIPYLCLKDLNLEDGHGISASALPSFMPIYTVT